MHNSDVDNWLFTHWRPYRSQLRFCIRATVAAISALLIAQFFALPLHGLWVVLTATVVTQLSVGGSVRSAEPLPIPLSEDLKPALDKVGRAISDYFRACALAFASRRIPPPVEPLQDELGACASELAAMCQRKLAHLSAGQLERLFALGFALEQLQQNLADLARCVRDWAAAPGRRTS
jgi:uncharacterized membrane protein YccC